MFKWLLAGIVVLSQGVAADTGIAPFRFGELEVIAIQDAASTMRRDLFPGIPEEEFLKLAGGPQAPASVNVYLLRSGGKLILLDTGYGGERGSLLKKLEALKISPDQIDAVLLTHMHGDHIGGLLTEQGNAVFPKATIHVSEPEHDYWQSGAAGARGELARKVLKVYMGRIQTFRFDDEVFPGIRALDASGHTPGHTVFETPSLLIVGDLLHVALLDPCRMGVAGAVQQVEHRVAARRVAVVAVGQIDRTALVGVEQLAVERDGFQTAPGRQRGGKAQRCRKDQQVFHGLVCVGSVAVGVPRVGRRNAGVFVVPHGSAAGTPGFSWCRGGAWAVGAYST